jgi:1-acyl-sn-glycerol-3-phosphate acyltransferase
MLNFLPGPLLAALILAQTISITIIIAVPLYTVALLKLAIPVDWWRRLCTRGLDELGALWMGYNNFDFRLTQKIKWDVSGLEGLENSGWYLVVSNHRTWVDIFVLQYIFNLRIPMLKFFIKKELIWMPILGLAWWALDFPFMQRYSDEFIKKNPHLKGKDLEATKKACEKFKKTPVSVMNFVEGTRFNTEKRDKQGSPFKHLLRPKAGGTAFVINSMGEQMTRMLDVTIVYPEGKTSFYALLSGQIREIRIKIEHVRLGNDLRGDYFNDEEYRRRFQEWVNKLWEKKDRTMAELLKDSPVV